MTETRILLGVIGRAHGVRGLVRVTSHAADPANLIAYGPLSDDKGRRFTLRWRGENLAEVAELVGDTPVKVSDRTAAEKLVNTRLYVERAQLPEPDGEEFYLADLIGMTALGPDGAELGKVETVHDYGAGASLEIIRPGAAPVLVPFTKACVPDVDLATGRVTVLAPSTLVAEGWGGGSEPTSDADQPLTPVTPLGPLRDASPHRGERSHGDNHLPATASREGCPQ